MGNKIAQQQIISIKCSKSRHVSQPCEPGADSSSTTIAMLSITCKDNTTTHGNINIASRDKSEGFDFKHGTIIIFNVQAMNQSSAAAIYSLPCFLSSLQFGLISWRAELSGKMIQVPIEVHIEAPSHQRSHQRSHQGRI